MDYFDWFCLFCGLSFGLPFFLWIFSSERWNRTNDLLERQAKALEEIEVTLEKIRKGNKER
jgi:hypothetical protein